VVLHKDISRGIGPLGGRPYRRFDQTFASSMKLITAAGQLQKPVRQGRSIPVMLPSLGAMRYH
jgi:hypothetical protein